MRLVTAAIITDKDKILLIKRAKPPYQDYWCFVGGCNAFNQEKDPCKAVKMEVEFDLNCKFNPTFFQCNQQDFDGEPTHTLFFYGNIDEEPRINPESVVEYKWFDLKEASRLTLGFDHNLIRDNFVIRSTQGAMNRTNY